MIPACRAALSGVFTKPSHPGLLLASYLRTTGDKGAGKRELLKESAAALKHAKAVYELAFRRWQQETRDAATQVLAVRGRLVLGLGAENVLETGLTLHHTYGTPILPGSALKGLASHYSHRVWGQNDPAFKSGGLHHRELFGATDDSGHIVFHDAWITPESLDAPNQGLILDVMTPHHSKYYMAGNNDNQAAPTDFDDPIPVAFLSVAGKFRVAVSCDVPGESGQKWAQLALQLLTEALAHWGVGGKTNSGYGRLDA